MRGSFCRESRWGLFRKGLAIVARVAPLASEVTSRCSRPSVENRFSFQTARDFVAKVFLLGALWAHRPLSPWASSAPEGDGEPTDNEFRPKPGRKKGGRNKKKRGPRPGLGRPPGRGFWRPGGSGRPTKTLAPRGSGPSRAAPGRAAPGRAIGRGDRAGRSAPYPFRSVRPTAAQSHAPGPPRQKPIGSTAPSPPS
jgi:hypothetical protein